MGQSLDLGRLEKIALRKVKVWKSV